MNLFRIRDFSFSVGLILVFLAGISKAENIQLENQCQPFIEKAINDLKKENLDTSKESETSVDLEQTIKHDSTIDKEDFSNESQIQIDNEYITSEEIIPPNLKEEDDEHDESKVNDDENQEQNNSHMDLSTYKIDGSLEEGGINSNTDDSEQMNDGSSENTIETDGKTELIEEEDSSNTQSAQTNEDFTENTIRTDDSITSIEEENSILRSKRSTNHYLGNISSEKVYSEIDESEVSENIESIEETTQTHIQIEKSTETSSESISNGNKSFTESADQDVSTANENLQAYPEEDLTNIEGSKEDLIFDKTIEFQQSTESILENDSHRNDLLKENVNECENGTENEEKQTTDVDDSEQNQTANTGYINITEETVDAVEQNINLNENNLKTEDNNQEVENNIDRHPEEDLLLEYHIPDKLRDRSHINELLHLNEESSKTETAVDKAADTILRDLKRIYDNAIKPLETLYKYRDLSNRHFGDPEIFSKPLVLFMGPWSGGKSTILNYLSENEYTSHSIRSGAEPSPAYFNILMYGETPEILDGTQLAADWTFSGLQKFGQGMLDRLRGVKIPSKILKKVNIVEIPGILEVRKQVSRLFPFNDACQWFIDRADIIFLVYDPSKLDVGPETEAILDQLKGREYQTKILLNKADTVKPEELLRVQSALIWNISPLMSSAHPPVLYTVSLWSNPYKDGAPVRLLQAQERALLKDLQEAIEKRIENKIASARRFAVRIRNHAKMVDCYLTTYYNHKTLFANKKQISDHIIENPSHYHIYEGLSTLTNISRYDLPNEEAYRDFFKLNPLYNFNRLAETCTYFKGCPINKLDIAISYQLPELVGKYKKILEQELSKIENENTVKSL